MSCRLLKSSSGFTLVELALSAALIGIISASLALILKVSIDLVTSSNEKNELVQEGRNGMNRIITELKHASEIFDIQPNSLSFDTTYLNGGSTETKHINYELDGNVVKRRDNYGEWQPFIGDVTNFRVGGMTLWTTLDDVSGIIFPKLGPGGTLNGVCGFVPMKFNPGFYSDENELISSVVFPALNVLYASRGTIEFWYMPFYSNDDIVSDHDKVLIRTSGTETRILILYYDHIAKKLIFSITTGTTKQVSWTPDWEIGSLVHIAVAWDSNGKDIGDGQTMVLFVDGVQRSDDGPQTTTWSETGEFDLNLEISDLNIDVKATAAFDNLKVYSYCKTNFDDRNREDAVGTITIRMTLDNGTDEITMRNAANVR